MASWFSAFCCLVVTKCGAGVHPYVFQVLETFFKQKTAYGISECDWSSDVCSSD
eukprot:COSAG06_NODE_31991_length_513_cov_0.584541_1_plen_53_part_10